MSRCLFRTKIIDDSCTWFLNILHLCTCVREERKEERGDVYKWCKCEEGLKRGPDLCPALCILKIKLGLWGLCHRLLPAGSSHWPHTHFKFLSLQIHLSLLPVFSDTPNPPNITPFPMSQSHSSRDQSLFSGMYFLRLWDCKNPYLVISVNIKASWTFLWFLFRQLSSINLTGCWEGGLRKDKIRGIYWYSREFSEFYKNGQWVSKKTG